MGRQRIREEKGRAQSSKDTRPKPKCAHFITSTSTRHRAKHWDMKTNKTQVPNEGNYSPMMWGVGRAGGEAGEQGVGEVVAPVATS